MKIAFIGCGLIGGKRGRQCGKHDLVGFYDINQDRSRKLSEELGGPVFTSAEELIYRSGAEVVVICAVNSSLAPLALQALRAGKHVLVEKPGAIRISELREIQREAESRKLCVKIGFNHRFHPALLKTRELIEDGSLGELMFMRARYGHGARLGYEKEWRADAQISGGGELIDQGVHLLDLIYWYLGPLPLHSAFVTTSFWDMRVDDNAVLTVSDGKKWATFHVSCSEWKNTFSLELYGKTGKVLIQGLGGSYGKETLTFYKMRPEMGPPDTAVFDFDSEDRSWEKDMNNLIDGIKGESPLLGDVPSAIYALTQVQKAYSQNGFLHLPCVLE